MSSFDRYCLSIRKILDENLASSVYKCFKDGFLKGKDFVTIF